MNFAQMLGATVTPLFTQDELTPHRALGNKRKQKSFERWEAVFADGKTHTTLEIQRMLGCKSIGPVIKKMKERGCIECVGLVPTKAGNTKEKVWKWTLRNTF